MTIKVVGIIFYGDGEQKKVNQVVKGVVGEDERDIAAAFFLDGPQAVIHLNNHSEGMTYDTIGNTRDSIQIALDGLPFNNEGEIIGEGRKLEASIPGKGHIEAIWRPSALSIMARR